MELYKPMDCFVIIETLKTVTTTAFSGPNVYKTVTQMILLSVKSPEYNTMLYIVALMFHLLRKDIKLHHQYALRASILPR